MSAPKVDVVAVMRAVAEFGVSAPEWHDMPEACAVVAELIEAARQVELIKFGSATLGRNAARKKHAIFQRFREALARIGGAK